MGWRFTATRPGLMPRAFWGLRRPGLLCATSPSGSDGGNEQGEQAAALPQQQVPPAPEPPQDEGTWMDLLLHGVRRGRLVLHLRQRPGEDAA